MCGPEFWSWKCFWSSGFNKAVLRVLINTQRYRPWNLGPSQVISRRLMQRETILHNKKGLGLIVRQAKVR